MKRFNILVPKEDGGVEVYAMKQWLRQHSEHVPSRLDAGSSTSHQLRDGLRRNGWTVRETPTETQLISPVNWLGSTKCWDRLILWRKILMKDQPGPRAERSFNSSINSGIFLHRICKC